MVTTRRRVPAHHSQHHRLPGIPSDIVLLYNMVLTTFYFLTMVLLLAILYDHMIMYLGLFGHFAVVFRDFMFFPCFYVLLTVCVVVFFSETFY